MPSDLLVQPDGRQMAPGLVATSQGWTWLSVRLLQEQPHPASHVPPSGSRSRTPSTPVWAVGARTCFGDPVLVAAISRVGEMPGPFRSKREIILKIRGWGYRPGPGASLSWASGLNEVTDNAVSPGQEVRVGGRPCSARKPKLRGWALLVVYFWAGRTGGLGQRVRREGGGGKGKGKEEGGEEEGSGGLSSRTVPTATSPPRVPAGL